MSLLDDPPQDWSIERQRGYFAWAEQVMEGLLGVSEHLDAGVRQVLVQGKVAFGKRE